jgi:hypothetical protein
MILSLLGMGNGTAHCISNDIMRACSYSGSNWGSLSDNHAGLYRRCYTGKDSNTG